MGYIEEIRALVGHRPMILVGAIVIVSNPQGEILLQQRKHPKGYWAIPGGLMELKETTEDTARRELLEEAGLTVGEMHLINVYSGENQYLKAPNGDEFYAVTVAYYSNDYKGTLTVDKTESLDCRFFHPHELPQDIVKSHKDILQEYMDKHYYKLY